MPTNNHLLALLLDAPEYRRTLVCRAVKLDAKARVYTPTGPVDGKPGQWLVTTPDGGFEVEDDEAFCGAWRKVKA